VPRKPRNPNAIKPGRVFRSPNDQYKVVRHGSTHTIVENTRGERATLRTTAMETMIANGHLKRVQPRELNGA
jgi:hypothetical protein